MAKNGSKAGRSPHAAFEAGSPITKQVLQLRLQASWFEALQGSRAELVKPDLGALRLPALTPSRLQACFEVLSVEALHGWLHVAASSPQKLLGPEALSPSLDAFKPGKERCAAQPLTLAELQSTRLQSATAIPTSKITG